jgi:uncharacterized protein with ParB-like and HNH nuclease domain
MDQKKLLIDTIFSRFDIPKFYLWRLDTRTVFTYPDGSRKNYYSNLLNELRTRGEADPYIWEVVDGQQRIRTMLEYPPYPVKAG